MIFDRKLYKKNAKLQLKGNFSKTILVTIITLVIAALISFITARLRYNNDLIPNLLLLAANLINYIVNFATLYFFIQFQKEKGNVNFSSWLDGLNHWVKALFGNLYYTILIVLWTFLLIIPGFIKAIAYSMWPMLIAEYPNLSLSKAIKISNVITQGYKMELFIMALSFIPWLILSACTGTILLVYTYPYMNLSFLNAYQVMKLNAINTGKLSPEDFE
jgi:uncharacterized membrane protein